MSYKWTKKFVLCKIIENLLITQSYLLSLGQFEITETPIEMGLARMENGMFKCLVCTREFQHNSTAKRHYKEKHLQVPECHECPYCGRKYTLLRYLKEHMSNIHQITQKMLNSRFLPNQDQ